MLALKQRVVRLAMSDSKQVVHVVEFDEDAEVKEHENLVGDRHSTLRGESETRCSLRILQLGKHIRRNSVILICTATKSTPSQQRISKQIRWVYHWLSKQQKTH